MKVKEDLLPIYNWIWFGLYRSEKGVCGYTYGMEAFGKPELEVVNADAQPSEIRDFLANLVSYVLEYDAVLQDGETIGFSAEDRHAISYGPGISLPDQMTLKIRFAPETERDGLLISPSPAGNRQRNGAGSAADKAVEPFFSALFHTLNISKKDVNILIFSHRSSVYNDFY